MGDKNIQVKFFETYTHSPWIFFNHTSWTICQNMLRRLIRKKIGYTPQECTINIKPNDKYNIQVRRSQFWWFEILITKLYIRRTVHEIFVQIDKQHIPNYFGKTCACIPIDCAMLKKQRHVSLPLYRVLTSRVYNILRYQIVGFLSQLPFVKCEKKTPFMIYRPMPLINPLRPSNAYMHQ